MNSPEPMTCEQASSHLLCGQSPKGTDLAQHIRSCLPCYRLANDLREIPALAYRLKESFPDPGDAFWQDLPKQVLAQIPLAPKQRLLRHLRPLWSIALPSSVLGAAAVAILFFVFNSPKNMVISHPNVLRVATPLPIDVETATQPFGDLLDALDRVALGRVAKVFDAEFSKTFLGDQGTASPIEEIETLDVPALRAVALSFGLKERI